MPRKYCTNCEETNPSGRWRAGPLGKGTLCNACGVWWYRHKTMRRVDLQDPVMSKASKAQEDRHYRELWDDKPKKPQKRKKAFTFKLSKKKTPAKFVDNATLLRQEKEMRAYCKKVDDVVDLFPGLRQTVSSLSDSSSAFDKALTETEKKVAVLNATNRDLLASMSALQRENQSLKNQLRTTNADLKAIRQRIDQESQDMCDLLQSIENIEPIPLPYTASEAELSTPGPIGV